MAAIYRAAIVLKLCKDNTFLCMFASALYADCLLKNKCANYNT